MTKIVLSLFHFALYCTLICVALLLMQSCTITDKRTTKVFNYSVEGKWITDVDSDYMLNPQTSGLTYHRGSLYSISDGSAHESQIKRLHKIHPVSAAVIEKIGPFKLSETVESTCFKSYLTSRPDYEGLVAIPNSTNQWLTVTEDATRSGTLSSQCRQRFKNTYSTEHPTLLVKLELVEEEIFITGVRALQFEPDAKVGNFPNDGIEGITITRNSDLLLGLEKDENTQARVFKVAYTDQMFDIVDEFLKVENVALDFPKFESGNHPINGMDVYYPDDNSQGYLIAAARNDDQLWIIDLSNTKPTTVINLTFYAPSHDDVSCEPVHQIKNTALEGVAIANDILYLINDPWKKVYPDNAICAADAKRYADFAPLIFELPIRKEWFN